MKHSDYIIKSNIRDALVIACKRLNLPKYEVSDLAPETLSDVISTYQLTGRLVVWSGASENTIFGSREANWLFRAWHDYEHIRTMGEFNQLGETMTCLKQMSQVGSIFAEIVKIEVIGQLKYQSQYGTFPANQFEFFKKQLKSLK